MRLYVAAPYAARDQLRQDVVPELERAGHTITAGWLMGTREITAGNIGTAPAQSAEEVGYHARLDLDQVASSDVLVGFTGAYCRHRWGFPDYLLHTGGRHVELGWALARGIRAITVGEAENIFQRTLTARAHSVAEVLALLAAPPPEPVYRAYGAPLTPSSP